MPSQMPSNPSVAVIGAGISGLSAAYRLLEQRPGLRIAVFESQDRPGGVIRTEQHDGFTLELGPDSMLARLPWGVDLCERLGLTGQMIGTRPEARGVYTVHRGRLTRMPEGLAIMAPERIGPMLTTPILSPAGKLRLAAERILPATANGADESLAHFAHRRLGREAFERIVQPLAGGIFMGDPQKLSLRACFPQFAAMEAEHGSLIRATRLAAKRRKAAANGPPPSVFTAPADGLGQMIEALAAQLGERVRLGQRIEQIEQVDGGWRLATQGSATAQKKSETFAAVIIATPAAATARLIAPLDERVSQILSAMEYSSCAIVLLAYETAQLEQPLDASGIVVPHVEGRRMQACSFSSVKYAGRAPDGRVLLRAFFGGALQPELPGLEEHELIELATRETRELLGATGHPLFARVRRWRESMPQYYVGHLQRVEEIEQRVAQLPSLELAGAAYRGVGIPHCIHSGEAAADRVLNEFPS